MGRLIGTSDMVLRYNRVTPYDTRRASARAVRGSDNPKP